MAKWVLFRKKTSVGVGVPKKKSVVRSRFQRLRRAGISAAVAATFLAQADRGLPLISARALADEVSSANKTKLVLKVGGAKQAAAKKKSKKMAVVVSPVALNIGGVTNRVYTTASNEVFFVAGLSYRQFLDFYSKNRSFFKPTPPLPQAFREYNRAIFEPIARSAAERNSLKGEDAEAFVKLVQNESGWDMFAVGRSGDLGITQQVDLFKSVWDDRYLSNPFNPRQALGASAAYYADLLKRFNGVSPQERRLLALTCYNQSVESVEAALRRGLTPAEVASSNRNHYAWSVLNQKL